MILTVVIMENPQLLRYSVEYESVIEHENEISFEGRYTLFEIAPEFIGRKNTIVNRQS